MIVPFPNLCLLVPFSLLYYLCRGHKYDSACLIDRINNVITGLSGSVLKFSYMDKMVLSIRLHISTSLILNERLK